MSDDEFLLKFPHLLGIFLCFLVGNDVETPDFGTVVGYDSGSQLDTMYHHD